MAIIPIIQFIKPLQNLYALIKEYNDDTNPQGLNSYGSKFIRHMELYHNIEKYNDIRKKGILRRITLFSTIAYIILGTVSIFTIYQGYKAFQNPTVKIVVEKINIFTTLFIVICLCILGFYFITTYQVSLRAYHTKFSDVDQILSSSPNILKTLRLFKIEEISDDRKFYKFDENLPPNEVLASYFVNTLKKGVLEYDDDKPISISENTAENSNIFEGINIMEMHNEIRDLDYYTQVREFNEGAKGIANFLSYDNDDVDTGALINLEMGLTYTLLTECIPISNVEVITGTRENNVGVVQLGTAPDTQTDTQPDAQAPRFHDDNVIGVYLINGVDKYYICDTGLYDIDTKAYITGYMMKNNNMAQDSFIILKSSNLEFSLDKLKVDNYKNEMIMNVKNIDNFNTLSLTSNDILTNPTNPIVFKRFITFLEAQSENILTKMHSWMAKNKLGKIKITHDIEKQIQNNVNKVYAGKSDVQTKFKDIIDRINEYLANIDTSEVKYDDFKDKFNSTSVKKIVFELGYNLEKVRRSAIGTDIIYETYNERQYLDDMYELKNGCYVILLVVLLIIVVKLVLIDYIANQSNSSNQTNREREAKLDTVFHKYYNKSKEEPYKKIKEAYNEKIKTQGDPQNKNDNKSHHQYEFMQAVSKVDKDAEIDFYNYNQANIKLKEGGFYDISKSILKITCISGALLISLALAYSTTKKNNGVRVYNQQVMDLNTAIIRENSEKLLGILKATVKINGARPIINNQVKINEAQKLGINIKSVEDYLNTSSTNSRNLDFYNLLLYSNLSDSNIIITNDHSLHDIYDALTKINEAYKKCSTITAYAGAVVPFPWGIFFTYLAILTVCICAIYLIINNYHAIDKYDDLKYTNMLIKRKNQDLDILNDYDTVQLKLEKANIIDTSNTKQAVIYIIGAFTIIGLTAGFIMILEDEANNKMISLYASDKFTNLQCES